MSHVFAYCRVSPGDQASENEIRDIAAAGFAVIPARVIAETISGSVLAADRPGFVRLTTKLEAGDVLVVTKLDRLDRSAMDVRATVRALTDMGVRVHCLALGGVDLASAAGKMTMGVIAAIAEFGRDLLVERTRPGTVHAKAQGKVLGRPPTLSPAQIVEVGHRLAVGQAVAEIARMMDTSRQTIVRARDSLK